MKIISSQTNERGALISSGWETLQINVPRTHIWTQNAVCVFKKENRMTKTKKRRTLDNLGSR